MRIRESKRRQLTAKTMGSAFLPGFTGLFAKIPNSPFGYYPGGSDAAGVDIWLLYSVTIL